MTDRYAICAECGKERPVVRPRGQLVMKVHNRWNGKKMILCAGSGLQPRDSGAAAPAIIFRNARG